MKVASVSQYNGTSTLKPMYAIVTVGRYSWFYVLLPDVEALKDNFSNEGKPYEFTKDEDVIDTFLQRSCTRLLIEQDLRYGRYYSSTPAVGRGIFRNSKIRYSLWESRVVGK
jgi:hypothetical protein